MLDKRDTVAVFRDRLTMLIERVNQSQARFAADAGLDRSTLSQLLSDASVRLPRAETIARIAVRHHVSIDWLLGLSQSESGSTDILHQLEIETGERSEDDERLNRWHREAAGYKIRYVPMSLPDLLKTEDVIEYEYRQRPTAAEARKEDAEERLAYTRKPETDMEVCLSFQALESFADGGGAWSNLSGEVRSAQIDRIRQLSEELYPTLRLFLFDGRRNYASPYTIFGPKRAAIYIGEMYFVFNSTEHIRLLTRHFDNLIRQAVVQPNDVPKFIDGLRSRIQ